MHGADAYMKKACAQVMCRHLCAWNLEYVMCVHGSVAHMNGCVHICGYICTDMVDLCAYMNKHVWI